LKIEFSDFSLILRNLKFRNLCQVFRTGCVGHACVWLRWSHTLSLCVEKTSPHVTKTRSWRGGS